MNAKELASSKLTEEVNRRLRVRKKILESCGIPLDAVGRPIRIYQVLQWTTEEEGASLSFADITETTVTGLQVLYPERSEVVISIPQGFSFHSLVRSFNDESGLWFIQYDEYYATINNRMLRSFMRDYYRVVKMLGEGDRSAFNGWKPQVVEKISVMDEADKLEANANFDKLSIYLEDLKEKMGSMFIEESSVEEKVSIIQCLVRGYRAHVEFI